MNSNCLKNIRCPECESEGPFRIAITSAWAIVTDDGSDEVSDIEWDDDSMCTCLNSECGHMSNVAAFTFEPGGALTRIFIGLYHHRHGVSVYPLAENSESELIAAIKAEGEELELDREDEWLEVLGAFDLPKLKKGKQP